MALTITIITTTTTTIATNPSPPPLPLAPLPSADAPTRSLQDFRIPTLPSSAYYIPDFITPAEEAAFLHKINTAPLPRWKTLSHRRLQAYPFPLTPASNTLLSAPLPDWLSEPVIERLRSLVLFSSPSSSSTCPSTTAAATATATSSPSSSSSSPSSSSSSDEETKLSLSVPSASQQSNISNIFSSAPHQAPNHVLVNEYLPGQGILPHEDGDAYYPVVVTVSLGAAVVLDIYKKGNEKGAGHGREPEWRILQERRSLLITADRMYTDYLHGIRGVDVDEEIGEGGVVNWALVGNKEEFKNGKNVRGTRVSLTFRDVIRVKSLGKAFGFARS